MNLATNNALVVWDTTGRKQYELTNHLGNVLATFTDKRLQHTTSGTSIDYYLADISTAQDYYSFGSLQPGRQYNLSNLYRYGFNGKENDNEIRGVGNQQDYGKRIYIDWVNRFSSVDLIAKSFPALSSYQFASNNPILNVDLDGLEASSAAKKVIKDASGSTAFGIGTSQVVKQEISNSVIDASGKLILHEAESKTAGTILGFLAKSISLTAGFVVMDAGVGHNDVTYKPKETLTTDPSTLTEQEIREIRSRISSSRATAQDLLYQGYLRERYPNSGVGQLLDKAPNSVILSFNLLASGLNRPDNVPHII